MLLTPKSHLKRIAIGKTGIGGLKRPPSPTALERAAKVARQSEVLTADEFRTRARKEYEDRRAEGRLRHARTTCVGLDAKADVKVRVKHRLTRIPFRHPSSLIDSGSTRRIRNHSPQDYWKQWKSFGLRLQAIKTQAL